VGAGPLEEPLEHLLCRFFREGEGEDLTWIDPLVEEVKESSRVITRVIPEPGPARISWSPWLFNARPMRD
jgi:hypothetical protein